MSGVALRSIQPLKASDPTADAYRRVRDATCCNGDIPASMSIAILEMVKAEILRDMQTTLDLENEE